MICFLQNATYLREKQGLDAVKAVLDTLTEAGYSNKTTTTRVMIQSTNSSVLIDFKKQSRYETVYKVEETIRDILDTAIEDIKKFADAVVISKKSVFPTSESFTTGQTKLVERLQKFQLPVYVEVFRNEFVSQPWDFFADATVEINSHVTGAGINGTITEFPLTAARYKSKVKTKRMSLKLFCFHNILEFLTVFFCCSFSGNSCLTRKDVPPYMIPVQPAGLLTIVSPASLPPAEAPSPVFTDADVTEPPLPPVSARAPTTTPGPQSTGEKSPNGQTRVALSLLLSAFATVFASLLLL